MRHIDTSSGTSHKGMIGDAKQADRYPRPTVVRVVRAALRQWWITVVFIVGSAISAIGQSLLQYGIDGLKLDGIRHTAVGQFASLHPTLFWAVTIILIALVPAGLLAQHDYHRERTERAEERDEERIAALIAASLQESKIEEALVPFELYKLRAPERFVDRTIARSWLIERLRGTSGAATFAVEGLGGIGKTSLVAETVQTAKRDNLFPDGIAVVTCADQFDPVAVLRSALASFTKAQEVYSSDIDALARAAMRILAGKRALIVLDNIEPGFPLNDAVRPLEGAGATLVITTRFRVPVSSRRDAIQLDVMDAADAREVFLEYYGHPCSVDEETAVTRIVDDAGRHTLAVVIAASYARESNRSLTSLATDLASADAVLDLDDDAHSRVRAIFQKSYKQLPADAVQAFQALSVMPTGDYTRAAAIATLESAGIVQPGAQIDTLVRRALLNQYLTPQTGEERLSQHPLLRVFSSEVASKAILEPAGYGMSEYYLQFARLHSDDYSALDNEYRNLVGGVTWAYETYAPKGTVADEHSDQTTTAKLATMVCGYMASIHEFLFFRGHQKDAVQLIAWGVQTAQQTQAEELLGYLITDQGKLARGKGDYDAAEQFYQHALEVAQTAASKQAEAYVLSRFGDLAHARHDFDRSLEIREQLRGTYHDLGDLKQEAHVMCDIGHVLSDKGDFDAALRWLQEALALAEASGNRYAKAFATHMTGQVYRRQGKFDTGLPLLLSALDQYTELRELGSMGGALEDIGRIEEAQGRRAEALIRWSQAMEIYSAMGIDRANYVKQNLIERQAEERAAE